MMCTSKEKQLLLDSLDMLDELSKHIEWDAIEDGRCASEDPLEPQLDELIWRLKHALGMV